MPNRLDPTVDLVPHPAEALVHLFEFIEVFCNRQRHQGGLGHLTPSEYVDKWRHDHLPQICHNPVFKKPIQLQP